MILLSCLAQGEGTAPVKTMSESTSRTIGPLTYYPSPGPEDPWPPSVWLKLRNSFLILWIEGRRTRLQWVR